MRTWISAGKGLRVIIITGLLLLPWGNAAHSDPEPNCDDANPDTIDTYDPEVGCIYTPAPPAEVPELEDYAAAAFLVLALTIGWQVRRRNTQI